MPIKGCHILLIERTTLICTAGPFSVSRVQKPQRAMIMDQPTHVIDPDGEVIIVLQNPNAPFAELDESLVIDSRTHTFPQPSNDILKSAEEIVSTYVPTTTFIKWSNRVIIHPCWSRTDHTSSGPTQSLFDDPAPEPPAPEESDGPDESTPEEPATEGLDKTCFRIQVSAKHLTLASSVFKKILTGGWKESIAYLQKGSVEITADSWDIEALLIMLRIIHCQFYVIPRKLTLEMLAKVAVWADYYDCRETTHWFANTWIDGLEETIPTTYSRDLIMWLWVAWYFKLPAQFKEATSAAMSWSTDRIDNLGLPIPEGIIRSINDRRQEAISGLVVQLHDKRDQLLSGNRCGFECSSIMYGALTKQMHSNALLSPKPAAPFSGLNYSSLVQRLSSFKSPEWCVAPSRYSGYRHSYDYSRHNCGYSTFGSLFGKLSKAIEGLELDSLIHE